MHPGYGPHHGYWDEGRPNGAGARCTDAQRNTRPGQPPCPSER
jgi:hypothetical protein